MMAEVVIDFSKYPDVSAFHADIAQKLGFPDYYGKNLDALHDMISSIPPDRWQFTIFYGGTGIPHKQQVMIAKILLRRES